MNISNNKNGHAVIYTRFSPRRNADDCQSCEWQRAECARYAAVAGLEVRATFDDPDVSGADAVRPSLWSAIDALKKGEVLLVWKWDRLARDLLLQLQIERAVHKKGATVVATVGDIPGDNPQATFMRQILGAVAELERKMISQRTSAAMRALQRSGRKMSKCPPYGWRVDPEDDSRIVEDADEQAVCREIVKLSAGGLGYRAIARALAERDVKSRSGGRISDKLVKSVVERRRAA